MWKLMFSHTSETGIICSIRYLTSLPVTMTALLIRSSNCLNIESNQYFAGRCLIREVSSLGDGARLHFVWIPALVKSSAESVGWHLNAGETDSEQTNGWLTGLWRWLFQRSIFAFCVLVYLDPAVAMCDWITNSSTSEGRVCAFPRTLYGDPVCFSTVFDIYKNVTHAVLWHAIKLTANKIPCSHKC